MADDLLVAPVSTPTSISLYVNPLIFAIFLGLNTSGVLGIGRPFDGNILLLRDRMGAQWSRVILLATPGFNDTLTLTAHLPRILTRHCTAH